MNRRTIHVIILLTSASLLLPGCRGKRGRTGPPAGASTGPLPTTVARDKALPGLDVEITAVRGASGSDGTFRAGDTLHVDFTVRLGDGTRVALSDLDSASIIVSGPTFNYQPVIERQTDLLTEATDLGGGSATYSFPVALPSTYPPPLFDESDMDGELTGQNLLAGTYTVGIEAYKSYTVGDSDTSFRDASNAIFHILYGGATTLEPREVVTLANCNNCHQELRVHGNIRRDTAYCALCHTSGAEDPNDPAVEGGTPGVSIDFRVLIHKIHAGAHLPSVLGVATRSDGTRDYTATARPYRVVGFRNSVVDFSGVEYPRWPSTAFPMPRDDGYGDVGVDDAKEDAMRSGPVDCNSCHGDPDGAGPLEAPSQGMLAYTQPTRRACGSCHDDVDWDLPYAANEDLMDPQPDDSECSICHGVSGSELDVMDAHLHPLLNPVRNPGLNFVIASLDEAGSHDADGTLDPGEKISLQFTIEDDAGNDILPTLGQFELIIRGPMSNPCLLHFTSLSNADLPAGPNYTLTVPMSVLNEPVGPSVGGIGETFTTVHTPHWTGSTSVQTWSVTATTSTLAADTHRGQNFVDVSPGEGALFSRDDSIVIQHGGASEEFMKIQFVDDDRLWFSTLNASGYAPSLVMAHTAGEVVTLANPPTALVENTDYTLDAPSGTITTLVDLGAGIDVVVAYRSDFVVPDEYPGTINDGPDFDASWGDWVGLPLVAGTYTLGIKARADVIVTAHNETNTYRAASPPANMDFLVGDATEIAPNPRLTSVESCNRCHVDLQFHGGGRRGVETCLLCHGVAGAEDRPRYVAANAPPTSDTTIDFRSMVHKIHMGEELSQALTYTVVGFGLGYPDNYSEHQYGEVVFPATPGGVMNCTSCHGEENTAWLDPAGRDYPDDPSVPPHRVWRAACGSCHDSTAAAAHIDANTSSAGFEACAVCHGPGRDEAVDVVHITR